MALKVSQCAARITRHRAASIRLLSWVQKSCFLLAEWSFFAHFRGLGDQFSDIFRGPGTHFRVPGPIRTISGANVRFLWKKWVHRPPPPKPRFWDFLRLFFLIVFFECSRFGIFELLDARRLHFSSHFDSFLGALCVLKNKQKCVSVFNFRGLASSECDFFEDFDHECVLTLIFLDFCDF